MSKSISKISLKAAKQYRKIAQNEHGEETGICIEKTCWAYSNNETQSISKIWCTECHANFTTEQSFLEAHKGGQS